MCSFFMSKYSDEFKIKAVQMVLDGNAVKYVYRILAIFNKNNSSKHFWTQWISALNCYDTKIIAENFWVGSQAALFICIDKLKITGWQI